jgi:alkylation response protein AidB-like acyl-CoA dehydrogenase
MPRFNFERPELPEACQTLRGEVRAFLAESSVEHGWTPNANFMGGFDPAFSRALGGRGWLGMTLPRAYGGQGRSALERYVVTEELLAAGAPVAAHWVADRQSGPLLLRFGSEAQKVAILPRIARGECYFAIGMSEPDSGSDLASVRTRATRVPQGWRIEGTKVWTSNAHRSHYMIALCRTGPAGEARHEGLSQFLIDLETDGVKVRPIVNQLGRHEFNEVVFDGTVIPADRLIGKEGEGWAQVTSELAYERSGPERFFGTFHVLLALLAEVGCTPDRLAAETIGRLVTEFASLRAMSLSVAARLASGETPGVEAALVKDLGVGFERAVIEAARRVMPMEPAFVAGADVEGYAGILARAILETPSFSLRGGTTEIMRSIIARGLGLR